MDRQTDQHTLNEEDIASSAASKKELPGHRPLTKQGLADSFKEFVLLEEKTPRTAFHFSKFLGIEEKDFYTYFSSTNNLEQEIWKNYIEETISRLKSEEVYATYGVREKLLAFFYTLLEVLKTDRSYINKTLRQGFFPKWTPSFLEKFKTLYMDFINALILEGKESGEVAERFLISRQYGQGLWAELVFILNFWVRDESSSFEQTDAAIEKAVNLSLDLMGKTALDSFADFAKFLYQSWK